MYIWNFIKISLVGETVYRDDQVKTLTSRDESTVYSLTSLDTLYELVSLSVHHLPDL